MTDISDYRKAQHITAWLAKMTVNAKNLTPEKVLELCSKSQLERYYRIIIMRDRT